MKKLIIGLAIILGLSVDAEAQDNKKKVEKLNSRQQKMITISALAAKGELELLKPELNAGLDAGLTINEIKEVMVHLYAYCGFPRSLRGLQTFMSVLDQRKANGIDDKQGKIASPIKDKRSRYDRGKEVLEKLSGVKESDIRTGYAAFSPEIEIFLKEHLFADLFERDVLTYADRELVTVSVLIGIGGVEPMLQAHIGLFLNQGLSPAQLSELINVIEIKVGKKEADAAKPVFNEVVKSKGLNIVFQEKTINPPTIDSLFPTGEEINSSNFTGKAWLKSLIDADSLNQITVGNVTFAAGARTNWHSHPGGQILLATGGTGYYQEKGNPIKILRKGDVIKCPPNIVHWHGASLDDEFTQVAITTTQTGPPLWLQPVTDEEYHTVQ